MMTISFSMEKEKRRMREGEAMKTSGYGLEKKNVKLSSLFSRRFLFLFQ